jgi:pimeloyl-ACP methyl ester carboxylesterase
VSAEAGSPITTYFRVSDGVRVRYADNKADSDITVLLLAPWPETLWAFRRIWDRVSAIGRVVAIDLPGFGHSDGRPELIAPDASGAFLAGLIDEWGLGAPHVVGPDVGTAAALFLAAKAPERVTSLTVGAGWTPEPTSVTPSRPLPRARASPKSMRTMSAPTTSGASRNRPGSCGITPSRTRCCAICCRRSPRRPRSWRGATMTSCRGRTISTSMTSSRTAGSILSTQVTSRGSRQQRSTGA